MITVRLLVEDMHGSGSAGPSHEPPRGVANARSDKPGGP
jgi:hypothetical protein